MGFGGLGFGEMVLIFAVLLLLFGAKRLPELAGGMGKGIRDFKRALNGMDDNTIQSSLPPTPQAQPLASAKPAAPAETSATVEQKPTAAE